MRALRVIGVVWLFLLTIPVLFVALMAPMTLLRHLMFADAPLPVAYRLVHGLWSLVALCAVGAVHVRLWKKLMRSAEPNRGEQADAAG